MNAADVTTRAMTGGDLGAVCEIAAAALPADPLTPLLFARKVFLDVNFDGEGVRVAEVDGRVVGFITAFARCYPIEDMADDSDRGFIPLFAVHPDFQRKGIGTALFEDVERFLKSRGRTSVLVGPYTPNWWVPGVDVNAYPGAIAFLEKRGYVTATRPLSMDASLVHYRRPDWVDEKKRALESEGISFCEFTPELILPLFDFLKREFPGDWQRHLRETAQRILREEYPPRHIHIALDGGSVVGFAHFEGERFGPFGTAQSVRGRGIGAVLLCLTVEAMRASGLHDAYFLWTSDQSARIYSIAGFTETRRFALMKKDLSG